MGGGGELREEGGEEHETEGWLHLLLSVIKGIYGRTGVQIGPHQKARLTMNNI